MRSMVYHTILSLKTLDKKTLKGGKKMLLQAELGGTGMEQVTTAAGNVLELTGTVLNTITGNPVLCFFLASSFVGVGIAVFMKLKNVAN